MCYATRGEMNLYFKENEFVLRTKESYENDLEMLPSLTPGKVHFQGIKRPCILNNLSHFHITENWINDSMHTALEGFIPYISGAVLAEIAKLCPTLTVAFFNEQLYRLCSNLIVEKANKPFPITSFFGTNQEIAPAQSSAQMWFLFRSIPAMIGDIVSGDEALNYWEVLILLQEIVDLIFASCLTESLLVHMSGLI